MTLDRNAVEAVFKALLIPVGSRIYGNGMATRELVFLKTRKDTRLKDNSISFQEFKKLNSEFR